MANVPDTGSDKTLIKSLLGKSSKAEQVSVAVGQCGAKGGEKYAMLMMHRSKGPKEIVKGLEKEFPDTKNARWGTAFVEFETDPGLVKFCLNKAGGGIAKRLAKTLKAIGSGYKKVEIYLEDGTLAEGATDDEDDDAVVSETDTQEPVTAAPPPPPTPPPPSFSAGDLQRMLAALIPRVTAIGEDKAPIKKALIKLAGDAGAQIKAAELTVAAQTIGQLKSALDRVQAAAPKVDATADTAIYTQSRLDWMATRESIETDLGKLRAALANTYKGEAIAGEIEKSYAAKVAPLMTTLDETLATKLDAATKAADAAARASLVTEAKAIMASYQAFVASNPLIADLDSNPFVPLSIQQNVSATLSRLSAAIN